MLLQEEPFLKKSLACKHERLCHENISAPRIFITAKLLLFHSKLRRKKTLFIPAVTRKEISPKLYSQPIQPGIVFFRGKRKLFFCFGQKVAIFFCLKSDIKDQNTKRFLQHTQLIELLTLSNFMFKINPG